MATQTIEIEAPSSAVTMRLFPVGSNTQTSTDKTVTIGDNGRGTAQYTDAPAGDYYVNLYNAAGRLLLTDTRRLTLTTATFRTPLPQTELLAAIDAIASSGGGGVNSVTITVNDGTDPIQNATVDLVINGNHYLGTTNVSGVAVISPDEGNGTYSVRISAGGYSFTPVSLVVSGDTSHTYSMSQTSISASPSGTVTGWLIAYDQYGSVESGVVHTLRIVSWPDSMAGESYDVATRTATSAANGLVQFTGMLPGVRYAVKRNPDGRERQCFAEDVDFELPNCSG